MQTATAYLYRFFLTLALAAGILLASDMSCRAQSLVIPVDAPSLTVKLLNPDGTFNQEPVLCTEAQEFSELLSPEAAALIAETRCRKQLLAGAAYNLKISSLLGGILLNGREPDFESLAQSLTRIIPVEQSQPDQEQGAAQMQTYMELTPAYADLSTAIKAGVTDSDYQRLISAALSLEKGSLEKIEEKLPSLSSEGGEMNFMREQVGRLSALRLCLQYLEPPKKEDMNSRNKAEQLEHAMNQAAKLDPANPVVFTILGRNQLDSGRTLQSVASFTQALKLNPDFLPGLTGRGTAYLHLNLLDLALTDYNRAIGIDSENPDYYMARASIWLIKEDFESMCKDFRAACSKGECEGYRWAVERKYCQ